MISTSCRVHSKFYNKKRKKKRTNHISYQNIYQYITSQFKEKLHHDMTRPYGFHFPYLHKYVYICTYICIKKEIYQPFACHRVVFLWIRKPSTVQKMLAVKFSFGLSEFLYFRTCVCTHRWRFCIMGSDALRPCRNSNKKGPNKTARSWTENRKECVFSYQEVHLFWCVNPANKITFC